MEKIVKSEEQWKEELSEEEYRICREKGTERAFTGQYWECTSLPGMYSCRCCGEKLFNTAAKYDSGSGWPSFSEPVIKTCVEEIKDKSLGMARTEVVCSRCDSHLGHVFPDGPGPEGMRYCINSASLIFDA